jgi:hypothetical protein
VKLDAMLVIKRPVSEQQTVGRHFAGQVFLRQRGALIGQLRFLADQQQSAGKPFAAKGVDRLRTGLPAADDEDGGDTDSFRDGRAVSVQS